MTAVAYTRFELVRTFRNLRLLLFSLGFPLVLYFLIAAPNRNEHSIGGTGISFPLYYMVGLVSFGAMTALISSGARIASRANRRLDTSASNHTAGHPRLLRRQGDHRLRDGRLDDRAAVRRGHRARRQPPSRTLARDDRADPGRADSVRGPGHPARPPVDRRLDRSGHRRRGFVARARGRHLVSRRLSGILHDFGQFLPSYWLVQASHVSLGGQAWGATGWIVIAAWTVGLAILARIAYKRDTGRV